MLKLMLTIGEFLTSKRYLRQVISRGPPGLDRPFFGGLPTTADSDCVPSLQ
jgi:hypothetical protein